MANLVRILYSRIPRGNTGKTRTVKFVVTFDEYNVIDTIEQVEEGKRRKLLVSTNKYAAAILRKADYVYNGTVAPVGFTWS